MLKDVGDKLNAHAAATKHGKNLGRYFDKFHLVEYSEMNPKYVKASVANIKSHKK